MIPDTLKQKVGVAMQKLRVQDSFLLQVDANERTISHKLADYLQVEFPDYDVDCEYNRHGADKKEILLRKAVILQGYNGWSDTEVKTVFPDIIIHKRGSDESNILVVEIKKSSSKANADLDRYKLEAFTREPYYYAFGLFLKISVDGNDDSLTWYSKGRVVE